MAEEAFVLSPMSARASPPSEADYDAIREAFVETARGRWFLNEYARRNRNTDTAMVLDAVARIESDLAAHKQAPAIGLANALGAIRSAIRDAKVTAAEAMPRADDAVADSDEVLAAARNGARIIREIASMLRQCGADTRICDLLDTQIAAIDKAQQPGATTDHRAAVLATFDTLTRRIEDLAAGTHAAQSAAAVSDKYEASVTPLFRTMPHVPEETEATIGLTEAVAQADVAQTVLNAEDSASQDLAVLDIVAMEMAAEDASAPESAPQPISENLPEPVSIAPVLVASVLVAPVSVAPVSVASVSVAPVSVASEAEASAMQHAPVPDQPSLGAALIASGLVPQPGASAADPLAPIRRMSQAEKIAFFS